MKKILISSVLIFSTFTSVLWAESTLNIDATILTNAVKIYINKGKDCTSVKTDKDVLAIYNSLIKKYYGYYETTQKNYDTQSTDLKTKLQELSDKFDSLKRDASVKADLYFITPYTSLEFPKVESDYYTSQKELASIKQSYNDMQKKIDTLDADFKKVTPIKKEDVEGVLNSTIDTLCANSSSYTTSQKSSSTNSQTTQKPSQATSTGKVIVEDKQVTSSFNTLITLIKKESTKLPKEKQTLLYNKIISELMKYASGSTTK